MDVQTGEPVDENILGEAPPEENQGRLPLDTEQKLDISSWLITRC